MLNKPTSRNLQSLKARRSHAAFQDLVLWIEESKAAIVDDMLVLEGNALYKRIGEVTILKDFVGHVHSASDDLDRIAHSETAGTA